MSTTACGNLFIDHDDDSDLIIKHGHFNWMANQVDSSDSIGGTLNNDHMRNGSLQIRNINMTVKRVESLYLHMNGLLQGSINFSPNSFSSFCRVAWWV